MKIGTVLRTLFGYGSIGFLGVICFIPCFLIALLPAKWRYDNPFYYFFAALFYKGICFFTFLQVTIRGKEYLPCEPAIFVANHQSSIDIPLLGSLIGCRPHVWLFLIKYSKVPIFGFIARRMNIVVDHSGLRKLVGSLEEALKIVKGKDRDVMIFPEGGRYNDGKIHNFFYGFAILAKETRRPVVPVLLINPGKVYPPGSFLLHRYPITIHIGKPLRMKDGQTESEFVQEVHTWFLEQSAEP